MSHAIRLYQTGGPEVLRYENVEVGEPGPGQARVRHSYVAVNFIDIYFRTGRYPLALPNGLGSDAVGVVEAVGPGVTDVKPGDRVGYLLGPQGAYSDVRVMPADVLIPLPDGVSDSTAATLMMKGMTAQYLFRQVYPLKGGETILYHAAAGGVGLIACQWAKALGVTMIGTVSTDAKAEIARAHGCAHVIVTSREDIAKRVREITDGKGVPVVYDSVGKDTLMASLDSLQPRGTLVSNGTSSGPVVIDTMLLAVKGSLWVTRPAMIHYATPRAHMLDMARELFDLVLAGKIRSEPSRTFALAEAAQRAPGPGIAPDHRRHRAGALSGHREHTMDLPASARRPVAADELPVRPRRGLVRLRDDAGLMIGGLRRPPGHRLAVPLHEGRMGPVGHPARRAGVDRLGDGGAGRAAGGAVRRPRQPREEHRGDGHAVEPGDHLLHVHPQLRPAAGGALAGRPGRGGLRLGRRRADRQPLSGAHARRPAGRLLRLRRRSARCSA